MPKISGTLQRACFHTMEHHLKDIALADSIPTAQETASIELFLGNYYYCDNFSGDISMKEGLNLKASKLGWVLRGRVIKMSGRSICSSSVNAGIHSKSL